MEVCFVTLNRYSIPILPVLLTVVVALIWLLLYVNFL